MEAKELDQGRESLPKLDHNSMGFIYTTRIPDDLCAVDMDEQSTHRDEFNAWMESLGMIVRVSYDIREDKRGTPEAHPTEAWIYRADLEGEAIKLPDLETVAVRLDLFNEAVDEAIEEQWKAGVADRDALDAANNAERDAETKYYDRLIYGRGA